MFDLDFFKKLNDSYGHPYGDYVLKTVAFICMESIRKTDLIGRYGGEEFCVLLPDTHLEGARLKAESIRKVIESHTFEHGGVTAPVTASFGVATFDKDQPHDTFEEMLRRADENLYKAKGGGRNQVV